MFRPQINLVLASTLPLGSTPEQLLACLDLYCSEHLEPVWHCGCQLALSDRAGPGWELYLVDDDHQARTLGFHDLGPDGVPRGFIDVGSCLQNGEPVSVCASHELAELLCNPGLNRVQLSPRGRWVAVEVADPVERERFEVAGLPVSDFVYPAWFGLVSGPPYDHLGICQHPWEILPGGYIPVMEPGGWRPLFGSLEAAAAFDREGERGLHRTERMAARQQGRTWAVPDEGVLV